MSFRTNFQVNTHIQSNFFIFKPLKPFHAIERSPTQTSTNLPPIFPTPSPWIGPPTGGQLESNEELIQHPICSIGTDVIVRNGKNVDPPCDQNILTRTVHTKPRIQRQEGTAAHKHSFLALGGS